MSYLYIIQVSSVQINADDNDRSSDRIIGEIATPNTFPWMAYLTISYFSYDNYTIWKNDSCQATLISEEWLLTSGSCFTSDPFNGYINFVLLLKYTHAYDEIKWWH